MDNTDLTLDQIPMNTEVFIKQVKQTTYACTLLTMGMLPDVKVRILRKSPIGQSMYVKVGNNFVAMRKSECESIIVTIPS